MQNKINNCICGIAQGKASRRLLSFSVPTVSFSLSGISVD